MGGYFSQCRVSRKVVSNDVSFAKEKDIIMQMSFLTKISNFVSLANFKYFFCVQIMQYRHLRNYSYPPTKAPSPVNTKTLLWTIVYLLWVKNGWGNVWIEYRILKLVDRIQFMKLCKTTQEWMIYIAACFRVLPQLPTYLKFREKLKNLKKLKLFNRSTDYS